MDLFTRIASVMMALGVLLFVLGMAFAFLVFVTFGIYFATGNAITASGGTLVALSVIVKIFYRAIARSFQS